MFIMAPGKICLNTLLHSFLCCICNLVLWTMLISKTDFLKRLQVLMVWKTNMSQQDCGKSIHKLIQVISAKGRESRWQVRWSSRYYQSDRYPSGSVLQSLILVSEHFLIRFSYGVVSRDLKIFLSITQKGSLWKFLHWGKQRNFHCKSQCFTSSLPGIHSLKARKEVILVVSFPFRLK